jgi:hypothetical protein
VSQKRARGAISSIQFKWCCLRLYHDLFHTYASCLCHSWDMTHFISLRLVSFERLRVRTAHGPCLRHDLFQDGGSLSWPVISRRQWVLLQHSLIPLSCRRTYFSSQLPICFEAHHRLYGLFSFPVSSLALHLHHSRQTYKSFDSTLRCSEDAAF